MAKKFRPVWGERLAMATRPPTGAASGATDAESGAAGGSDQALFALRSMLDRGLIDRVEYEARKAEIEAGKPKQES